MRTRLIGAAIVGVCIAAASPAMAWSGEATATPPKPETYRPSFLDQTVVGRRQMARPASPDVFGTVALNAGVTFYDARFRRVSATDARHPLILRLAGGAAGLDPVGKLRLVQQLVSRHVRWQHDLDNMGVADFWANAGETLRRGTGDSEDIAIVKMQVLKAAGFNPSDLYLSIGRHNVRGSHIVLLARTALGFFVLDDTNHDVMTPAQHGRFTPIMTLGQGISFLHGRRVGGPRVASAGAVRSKAN